MGSYIKLCVGDDDHPEVEIRFKSTVPDIQAVLDNLIKPALLAGGFMEDTVKRLVVEDREEFKL